MLLNQRNEREFTYKLKRTLAAILLVIITLISSLSCGGAGRVTYAATITSGINVSYGSSVLDDLKKASEFNQEDFPARADDYSLTLIQIAETDNKKLVAYVYQPSGEEKDLRATSLNLYTQLEEDNTYKNYKLKYLNSSGVFYKYLVLTFTVSNNNPRNYEVSSIYRAWDNALDGESENDGTISEIAYSVGKLWTAETVNGKVYYTEKETQVVEIINPYHSYLRYYDGVNIYSKSCDSQYIAFATNLQIDNLMQAEVMYSYRGVEKEWVLYGVLGNTTYTDDQPNNYVTLTSEEIASNPADGLFAVQHTWDRIASTEDFIASEDLTEEEKANLTGTEWVLRFVETPYVATTNSNNQPTEMWIEVYDVAVLRLSFVTNGVSYNMGAVSSKVTGSGIAGNTLNSQQEYDSSGSILSGNGLSDVPWYVWAILIAIVVVLLVVLFKEAAAKAIVTIFKVIVKIIVFIITLPFRLISMLVEAIEKKKGKKTKDERQTKNGKTKGKRTERQSAGKRK